MKPDMKAVVLEQQGGPEVLRVKEVEEKKPRRNEVLVKLEAAGLNRIDIWVRSGVYKIPLPRIPGADGAGVVEEVGEDVTMFSKGDRVLINPALTCGACRYCQRGWDSLCENHRLLGHGADGTYAEKITLPANNLHKIPEELSTTQAGCIMVTYATAWHALVTRAGILPGSTVLVIGGGSGVGISAIQLSKLLGCTVITTVGEDWKAEKAYRLGADYVINRRKQSVSEAVKEFTHGMGVDLVLEHAGQAVWEEAVKSLAPGGKMVYLGATSGENASVNIRYTYRRQISLLGSYGWNRQEIPHVLRLFETGKLRPIIHKTFPLAEAVEAHQLMESDNFFGKIVLLP